MTKKIAFRLLLAGWVAFCASLQGAEAPRTAVLDFTWAHAPGGIDPALADFSRGVQAQLLTDANYAWIERQEFDRISAEVDLGRMSGGDALAAVRLGHWLRADLLLRGELAQGTGQAELKLEVIDLKRAEVLAGSSVVLPLSKSQRLHVTAADITAAVAAARQALADARRQLEKMTGLKMVAPLHFKGLGTSNRLGFLEARLTDALAKAAERDGGVHVLRFLRTTDAGEEASLVLAGLTDATPEVAQQVADSYVWGTFTERDPGGVPFEEVPVTINVQVWDGRGEPIAMEWSGLVKGVGAGLDELAHRIMAATKAPGAGTGSNLQQREHMAQLLGARAEEVGAAIQHRADFLKSVAGRQLYALRLRLLETACFFDPLNRDLQEKRVRMAWDLDNPLQPLRNLRGWWLRIADLSNLAKRFEHRPDGTVDETWPSLRTDALFEFIHNVEKVGVRDEAELVHAGTTGYVQLRLRAHFSPEEKHEQLRATIRLWSQLVAGTGRLVAAEKTEPAWFAALRKKWVDQLQGIHLTTLDPIIFHSLYEEAWPALAKEVGHRMKLAAAGKGQPPELELAGIYTLFGEDLRVDAMLDQAWDAYKEPLESPPPVAVPAPKAKVAPARPPRTDQAWVPRAATIPAAANGPQPRVPPPAVVPELKATIREIDFKPVLPYYRAQKISDGGDLLQKATRGQVKQIAWHAGRFWLAEEGAELPKEIGVPNPQGNHYLWAYDPVQHTTELITTQLGGHATLTSLISGGNGLWLSSMADGVWRAGSNAGEVKRFTDVDGLASPKIHSGTRIGDDLFFVGGEYPDFVISRYSLKDGAWSTIHVPTPEREAKVAAEAKARGASVQFQNVPQVAVSGDWLCFSRWSTYYQLSTRQWFDPRGLTGPKPSVGNLAAYGFSLVSADSSGFWCGISGGFDRPASVGLVDPTSGVNPTWIRLPGVRLKALRHHGPWLWVLTESMQGGSALFLVDKKSQLIVGRLELPAQEADALWVADDRLWVGAAAKVGTHTAEERYGLPALLDIRLAEARPSGEVAVEEPPGAFPLLAAVRRADPVIFEKALAANDVNQAPASGWTALMGAVDQGRADWVERLLIAGADPNRLSVRGESALGLAVRQGDVALAEILLKHRANPELRPRTLLLNLTRTRQPIISAPSGAPAVTPPAQPETLRAAITEYGQVQLSWDDRATNETSYEVSYSNGRMWRPIVTLPANTTSWTDPEVHAEAEHSYRIKALNGVYPRLADGSVSDVVNAPEVRLPRPPPAGDTKHFMYGFNPNGTELLAPRFVVPPPLSLAAARGDEAMVKLLLSHQADPNQPDAAGSSPLMHALRHRQYAIARQLLAAGARPDLEESTGETPVSITYGSHEDRELLGTLLQAMSSETRRTEVTMLFFLAVDRGQIADIVWLQSQGGELGDHIVSALGMALVFGQTETAVWLWNHLPGLQARWRRGEALDSDEGVIAAALRWQNPDFFEAIIEAGCSPNLRVKGTPLAALAAQSKAFDVLDVLWKHKADFRAAKVLTLLSPLEAARYMDQPATAKGEVARPPNGTYNASGYVRFTGPPVWGYAIDSTKKAANEALLAASERGDLAAVMRAVAEGAQLEATNPAGRTALIEAVKAKALPVVRWLVEEGAHVNHLSEKGGASPLAFAVNPDGGALVEYLLAAGADVNRRGYGAVPPLTAAIHQKDSVGVARLLDAGADPNYMWADQSSGQLVTALAMAAWVGQESIADLLLSRGANPRAQSYDYLTTDNSVLRRPAPSILMFAALGKNVALLRKLVALGQNPRLTTGEGYDALSWAAREGAKEAVEYLLPLSEHKGRALESALEKGHTDIAEILRRAGYAE